MPPARRPIAARNVYSFEGTLVPPDQLVLETSFVVEALNITADAHGTRVAGAAIFDDEGQQRILTFGVGSFILPTMRLARRGLRGRRLGRGVLLPVFVVALLAGSGALAATRGGGGSIATAPALPIGQRIVDGATDAGNREGLARLFWRISLAASDQLRIDYGSTNGELVRLYLYGPNVTDYTFRNTNPLTSEDTQTKDELKFVAPNAGRYTLLVWNYDQLAYEIEAFVRHHTITALSVPTLLNANASLPIRGSVTGTSGGRLLIRVTGPRRFKRKAVVRLGANGAYSWRTRIARSGVYRVRAIYYGDDEHLPSSASRAVRVG